MSKEILINIEPQEKRVAVVSDGQMEEFYIERPQDKTIVGNIYKGKIEAVVGGRLLEFGHFLGRDGGREDDPVVAGGLGAREARDQALHLPRIAEVPPDEEPVLLPLRR